ncbi:MAG: efflux RND transporter permease subunit [Planctomycetes bacterium]|nr:efflux RND transporter permease subunit [Planctomycetota bacterium]
MSAESSSAVDRLIGFCLGNKLVVGLLTLLAVVAGLRVAPFPWDLGDLPRDPVPVDAIPDTGENQQIVFTAWPGRSPQDVEDQVTYPLTVALLGVPGVTSIRSSSMFGVSSIFVVFDESVEFYWSRSRLVEKLASLPSGTLPDGVQPALGPDATPLGQVLWYTLEGRDEDGRPTGGWDLDELRSAQDWYVRYALASVEGVAEVASIGGHVREYQIDVDPDAMRAHGVMLHDIFRAVQASNVDVGARTIELNQVEYVVRGLGFLKSVEDLEAIVVAEREDVPITIGQLARVGLGPALRRGALDKDGAEAVGGVVVVRYGANPLAVIEGVRHKLAEIAPGMPSKVLEDGRTSRLVAVPFYDRSGLIHETLGTLGDALELEVLVTLVVVLVMVGHLRSAGLIAGLLPLAVLLCFVAMKAFRVDANIVALSGIAIAIGTMVDMGIVLTESILGHLTPGEAPRERLASIRRGAAEVGGAVLTAVLTTVVGFLPVFTMVGAEGKLFRPLAFTKTFALIASILVALVVLPAAAHVLLREGRRVRGALAALRAGALVALGVVVGALWRVEAGVALAIVGLWPALTGLLPERARGVVQRAAALLVALAVAVFLAGRWEPLGPGHELGNVAFTVGVLGGVLLLFQAIVWVYEPVLGWCLRHKLLFLSLPALITVLGLCAWRGFDALAGPAAAPLARAANVVRAALPGAWVGEGALTAADVEAWGPWAALERTFPGLGQEFMPALDEGSFLLMPVTMAHASISEALDLLQQQDLRIRAIPEVDQVVGKIGRAESPLDPAPVSMVETVITYLPEYRQDEAGRRLSFRWDDASGAFARDAHGELIPDEDGRPFRQWRDEVRSPRDIWDRIEAAARVPGMTTASRLQPIETRRIMLQTGMRAPMGIKVYGPDLETIEEVALELEALLKEVPAVRAETVLADRVIGKPYLELEIDREAIARHGLSVRAVQDVIEVAVGGRPLTRTVEGRERYPVRVRYPRERRDSPEELANVLIAGPGGAQVPLGQLADLRYTRGPQVIKSEDTFLTAYVLFDKRPEVAEVDAVEDARAFLEARRASGELVLPEGVSYRFAGNYENQVRATATLRVVLPLALLLIFLLLYLQFRSTLTTGIVFSGVFVAWSGGFLMLWLYGQGWFLDGAPFGVDLRELFGVRPYNLSVAVWVGFLALFGIASDDGVVMATYLDQSFARARPADRAAIRAAVVRAGKRRIRPCLMTTATTLLALLPVLTSKGRGSDVMIPMAIPSIGGMTVELVTLFVVPVLYSLVQELRLRRAGPPPPSGEDSAESGAPRMSP